MAITTTLTDQDKTTLRVAAWGAVSLMSAADAAGSAHKAGTAGSIALTSATGPVGHILAKAPKSKDFQGKTIAELADQVLPALANAVRILNQQTPTETDNFRTTVLVAINTAAQASKGQPSPVATEMIRKITAALDAA